MLVDLVVLEEFEKILLVLGCVTRVVHEMVDVVDVVGVFGVVGGMMVLLSLVVVHMHYERHVLDQG